jgi:hypothetical protein
LHLRVMPDGDILMSSGSADGATIERSAGNPDDVADYSRLFKYSCERSMLPVKQRHVNLVALARLTLPCHHQLIRTASSLVQKAALFSTAFMVPGHPVGVGQLHGPADSIARVIPSRYETVRGTEQ